MRNVSTSLHVRRKDTTTIVLRFTKLIPERHIVCDAPDNLAVYLEMTEPASFTAADQLLAFLDTGILTLINLKHNIIGALRSRSGINLLLFCPESPTKGPLEGLRERLGDTASSFPRVVVQVTAKVIRQVFNEAMAAEHLILCASHEIPNI